MSLLTLGFSLFLMPAMAIGQNKVNLNVAKGSLTDIFAAIQQQTDYRFLYSTEDVRGVEVSQVRFSDSDIREVLSSVLSNTGLTWQINDDVVSVKKITAPLRQQPAEVTVTGRVVNAGGSPLAGVTVMQKDTRRGVITDRTGNFSLRAVQTGAVTIVFSFIGMETVEMVYRGQPMNVVMREGALDVEEVVITGLYTRAKESFTGSSSTFTAAELKTVGNQNILQSLKTLDPAFAILDNDNFGSDPNTMPDIEVRGKTSVAGLTEEYGTNPNQPLFIVDGFESTLSYVMDMSMDMVESITILKDAASTAIWGSKAANGVIVIETRRPEMGKLRLSYNGNFNVSFPDLSDYNLMNAGEKLEYELLSGRWGPIDENGKLKSSDDENRYMKAVGEVARGVDTYWLHLPLRVGFTNKHTVFAEGGANEIRYGVGLSYGNTQGVMIGSDRETFSGNVRLNYRMGNLSFNNILTIDNTVSERENVEFSRFALMNPYLRKTDQYGDVLRYYDYGGAVGSYRIFSPLWDMDLGSFNRSAQFLFSNSFEVEWKILSELRARGRIGIGKGTSKTTVFTSPFHTNFIGRDSRETGSYARTDAESLYYSGDMSLTYGKLFNELHMINAVLGFTFRQDKKSNGSYEVTGFTDDEYPNPNAAEGFRPDTKPTYMESKSRSASYYLNLGYAFNERYLLDANFRMDGSSIFGVDHHFTYTWSVGVAWNVHKENFMANSGFTMLKLRASMGNPGNQNFDDYISERVYVYQPGNPNKFDTAMIVKIFGNKNLKWQKTLDRNIGFDLEALDRRLRINFDYYHKETDPLLVYIGIPSSTGVGAIPYNLGMQRTKGMTATFNYQIIRRQDFMWSVNINARSNKSTYHDFGDSLEKYNESNRASNSLSRYYDGGSPSDLWAVRSLGIDPGTGREIFVKLDGTYTFGYDKKDEVVVGNTESDVEGIIGTRFYYKGFSLNVGLRYRLGGQAFMRALYDKVENVDRFDRAMGKWHNQDKRALYDRWKNAGDDAKFLGITQSANPITSRFVMDNNVLVGESISLSYETQADWLKTVGVSSMNFSAYMNDIFRLSTIKNERGIEYPYARSVSFSIGLRF